LATRVVMRDRPEVFHLAVAMLQERIGPSSPDDLAPTAATQHDVAQEPNAHDG
jgi:hypothetical protein